jgi:hypothetical protein
MNPSSAPPTPQEYLNTRTAELEQRHDRLNDTYAELLNKLEAECDRLANIISGMSVMAQTADAPPYFKKGY